jgi:hypothetical protein
MRKCSLQQCYLATSNLSRKSVTAAPHCRCYLWFVYPRRLLLCEVYIIKRRLSAVVSRTKYLYVNTRIMLGTGFDVYDIWSQARPPTESFVILNINGNNWNRTQDILKSR